MDNILVFATVLVPILTGIAEMVKQMNLVDSKYIPLISVVVGILLGLAAVFVSDLGLIERGWSGLVSGLAATGLYEFSGKIQKLTKPGKDA